MKLHLIALHIPFVPPIHAPSFEHQLQQAVQQQLGDHQLLRWAITAIDPQAQQAAVEAVVTVATL